MKSEESTPRNIAWGPWIIVAVGDLLFLLGAARFVLRHRFGSIDALYCSLAVVPAAFVLLVLAYVIQHARLASVIPLFAIGVLAFSFPIVDISLGLALMGVIVGPALSEWKNERLRKSTTAHGPDMEERK